MNLKDKVCVITGGARGIGLAMADALIAAGAKVALGDADVKTLNEVEGRFPKGTCIYVQTDVRCPDDINGLAEKAAAELGPVAVWINNAGVARHRLIPDYKEEDIDWMVDVNIKGTVLGSQAALSQMIPQRQGHIINVISTAGLRGIPTESVYCATKAAARSFTQALQEEVAGYGIRVTALLPGGVNTTFWQTARPDHVPVERFLTPQQVADAAISVLKMDDTCVTHEIIVRCLHDADFTLKELDPS